MMSPPSSGSSQQCYLRLLVLLCACCLLPLDGFAAPRTKDTAGVENVVDAEKFFAAIVKVQTRAVADARTAATLGTQREGTGVVIDKGGLILTIGYLLVEADEVNITDDRGHALPAKVVAYDHVPARRHRD